MEELYLNKEKIQKIIIYDEIHNKLIINATIEYANQIIIIQVITWIIVFFHFFTASSFHHAIIILNQA